MEIHQRDPENIIINNLLLKVLVNYLTGLCRLRSDIAVEMYNFTVRTRLFFVS